MIIEVGISNLSGAWPPKASADSVSRRVLADSAGGPNTTLSEPLFPGAIAWFEPCRSGK